MKPLVILLLITWLTGVWFLIYGFGLLDIHQEAGQAYLIAGAILNGSSLIGAILYKRP